VHTVTTPNPQVTSDRDALGNTALHMAVIHQQPDM
jgi:ankyrin repeat protein